MPEVAQRGRGGSAPGATARRVAFDVLQAVRVDDAYANLLLPARIARAHLSTKDAAFATELAYGTLRMLGYYDRVIALAARRPTSAIDPDVLDVLRLGAHQLLTLRTPTHAAVNESVSLSSSVAGRKTTGFVNAVLRSLSRTPTETWRARVAESQADPIDRLAAERSHPAWIVRALRDALIADGIGPDRLDAELVELLDADNRAARPTLAVLPPSAAPASSSTGPDLPGTTRTELSPVGRRLDPGADLASIDGIDDGWVRVQDEGSQLAALALSRARPVRAGERWLDLCAGPGGKSALLGVEAARGGASLVANEINPARAGLVRSAVRGVHPAPEVWEEDGRTVGASHPRAFDRILVDAPCTGLGALRRRPESRWRRSEADVAPLVVLQSELLDSAVRALAPGGLLAYVTCSPHVAETREQVAALVARHPDLVPVETAAVLDALALTPLPHGPDPHVVQLWPQRDATDAMFIALFTRP